MPFSFKPTQGTESKEANPAQTGGVASSSSPATPVAMSYSSRFGGDGKGLGIIPVVVFNVFGLCLVSIVLLVGYQQYLTSQINDKKAELAREESKLGALPLEDMRKLSNRIKIVSQLVKDHASVRVAFRIIEDSIENPVTYKNFNLSFSESTHSYQLRMAAVAEDYHSVIQQMETFKSKTYTKYIPSFSFDGLNPDDKGNIIFNIKMPIMITGLLMEEVLTTSDETQPESSATSSLIYNPINSTSTVISNSTSTNNPTPPPVVPKTIIPKKP